MELACPECGKIRKYKPATIARLRSHVCQECRFRRMKSCWVTLKCPHCGRERAEKPSEATSRTSQSCYHCARYVPGPLPETFDAGYVIGAILGDGYLAQQQHAGRGVTYTIRLHVTDRAFAERFRDHLGACTGRRAWIKSYEYTRKANPAIGMPETRVREWVVVGTSREWWDKLKPYKIDRKFGDLCQRSEKFRRGFFQGILDAEGCVNAKYTDIANTDIELLKAVKTGSQFSWGEGSYLRALFL
jgi:hypothetical protein